MKKVLILLVLGFGLSLNAMQKWQLTKKNNENIQTEIQSLSTNREHHLSLKKLGSNIVAYSVGHAFGALVIPIPHVSYAVGLLTLKVFQEFTEGRLSKKAYIKK